MFNFKNSKFECGTNVFYIDTALLNSFIKKYLFKFERESGKQNILQYAYNFNGENKAVNQLLVKKVFIKQRDNLKGFWKYTVFDGNLKIENVTNDCLFKTFNEACLNLLPAAAVETEKIWKEAIQLSAFSKVFLKTFYTKTWFEKFKFIKIFFKIKNTYKQTIKKIQKINLFNFSFKEKSK